MKFWHPAMMKVRNHFKMKRYIHIHVIEMVESQKKCEECGGYPVRTYGFNSSDMSFTGFSRRVCGKCVVEIIKGE